MILIGQKIQLTFHESRGFFSIYFNRLLWPINASFKNLYLKNKKVQSKVKSLALEPLCNSILETLKFT